MPTFAITATKGGVGKTTLTCGIATVLGQSFRTLVIDADPQLSFQQWMHAVEDSSELPFEWLADADDLDYEALAEEYEMVVIDTPPGTPDLTAKAIAAADICLIPFLGGLDVPHVINHAGVVAGTQSYYVLNRVGARASQIDTDVWGFVENETGIPVLHTQIPDWKTIRNLLPMGRSMPLSGRVYDRFENLVVEINDRAAAAGAAQ